MISFEFHTQSGKMSAIQVCSVHGFSHISSFQKMIKVFMSGVNPRSLWRRDKLCNFILPATLKGRASTKLIKC
jgi:hypothetical protein